MPSVLNFFGTVIPLYGIFYYLGIFCSVLAAFLFSRKIIPAYDLVCSAIYTVLCGVAGAKILFLAVSLPRIIELGVPFTALLKGGFVFYGGLIGGVLGLFLYCRQFKLIFLEYACIYTVVLPLGHAFGRIGCFFAGCCYGKPYDGLFAVTYKETVGSTPLHTPLFPVQLLESTLLILLFLFLAVVYRKGKQNGRKYLTVGLYAVIYACIRFVLEEFRYDQERGTLWLFSTSQWISIVLLLFGIIHLLAMSKRRRQPH